MMMRLGVEFQGLLEDHLAAPRPVARLRQVEGFRLDPLLPNSRPSSQG